MTSRTTLAVILFLAHLRLFLAPAEAGDQAPASGADDTAVAVAASR